MEHAVRHHLQKGIKEQKRLTGGYTFQTWLLTLSDNQKVVFRAQRDLVTGGGRKIVISEMLTREKYFYDNVNSRIGHICPEVYIVDGTFEHFDMSFCIMEYIEGTPLDVCFKEFDRQKQDELLWKIGETAARINKLEIDGSHPYITDRGSWEKYVADRLAERLKPLIDSDVITQAETDAITSRMLQAKAVQTSSFLHLDMRHANMIYNNGEIFVLDAENCEFGDPLCELAVVDVAGELAPPLTEGYKNISGSDIKFDDELFYLYKMERQALVLHLFMNIVKTDVKSTELYLSRFNELKKKLL